MTPATLSDHGGLAPSHWVRRWSHLVPSGAHVLDVACGPGRHVRWFAEQGCRVTAIDRDTAATEPLRGVARVVIADLEGAPWPLAGEHFDAVLCTHYLWRPLLPTLVEAISEKGVLIYETFAVGNETVGKPSNPDFLLRPGELLDATRGLRVVAYEDGFLADPPRYLQRIVAARDRLDGPPERRRLLEPG